MKDEMEDQKVTDAAIKLMVKTLQDVREKINKLSNEGKERVPRNFYENELQDLMKTLPSLSGYIKSLCMDKTLTPEKIVREIDETIDYIRSGKILDKKARREIAFGPWLYWLREELDRRLNDVSELKKIREEIESTHKEEMKTFVNMIRKTEAFMLEDRIVERLLGYRERLTKLMEEKKKAEKDEERNRINEKLIETRHEIDDFLEISDSYFTHINVIKACSKMKDENKRTKFLKQSISYNDETRRMLRFLRKIPKIYKSQIELKNVYNSLLKKKSKMGKNEYERELKVMIQKFLNDYPDYKIFFNPETSRLELSIYNVFETRERELNINEKSAEWLENSFIRPILAVDLPALLKEMKKEVQLRVALINMMNSHLWKHEVNEKLTELYCSGKISWFELVYFLSQWDISVKNIENEAFTALQKNGKNIEPNAPIEMLRVAYSQCIDMLGFYLKAMGWSHETWEDRPEEMLLQWGRIMVSDPRKAKVMDCRSMSGPAIRILNSKNVKKLMEDYKLFNDLLKNEKIAGANESLKEVMKRYVENVLVLFQHIFLYCDKSEFKEAFDLFNDYLKILLQIGRDMPDLEPATGLLLLRCMTEEYYPLSYAIGAFLCKREQYEKATQILFEAAMSDIRYPIDLVICCDKVDKGKVISYEESGRIEKALKEIKKIQLMDGMGSFGLRVFKMIQYSNKLPNSKSILLEAMEDCQAAEKYINENWRDSDDCELSDIAIFNILKRVIEIKLAEYSNTDKPSENLRYIG